MCPTGNTLQWEKSFWEECVTRESGREEEGSARNPGWWGEECHRLTLDKTAPAGECTLFLNYLHLQAKRPFALSSP